MARKELGCEKKGFMRAAVTVRLLQIRYQESVSGDCNSLRTLVDVTVNCKMWKSAIAL
jgi:hypothetical protein